MKHSRLFFFLVFVLLVLSHLGFALEANSFLNGVPTLLSQSDRVVENTFKERVLRRTVVKVKVGGEIRYRLELRNNFTFNDATNEDDAVNLFRNRLNIDLSLGPYLHVFSEGQDAESVAQSGLNRTTAFVNRFDLRQLYVETKSPSKKFPLQVKAGRQVLSYGDQRFVGGFDWSNVARVFDAAKIVYPVTQWFQTDLWFAQVVPTSRSRLDSAAHHDNFYGIYTTLKPFSDHLLDTFLFIRHDRNREITGEKAGARGQLKEFTFGNRFKGKKWNWDYGTEWAVQFGSRAHERIGAWALHQELGYTFIFFPWSPRLSAEFNHGSGDHDPKDGKVGNFDNLFPTNHIHYGYIDFASLRNMNDIKVGGELKPNTKLKCSVDYHWFFLDTSAGPWFNAGQSVVRAANPDASITLGQEIDLLMRWKLSHHFDFLMGYSRFLTGPFVEDTGVANNADFFYIQPTFSF